jgi:hypothetical protein
MQYLTIIGDFRYLLGQGIINMSEGDIEQAIASETQKCGGIFGCADDFK